MKKFVALILGLSIVAFWGTVYAQKVDLSIKGNLDFGTFWYKNVSDAGVEGPVIGGLPGDYRPGGGALDKDAAFAVSRARLQFDAAMGKEIKGTILFEIDSAHWGDTPSSGTRNSAGFWGADRAAVEVKNFYIDFAVPYFGVPVPMTVRVGVQPHATRSEVLVYTDGAGITAGFDMNPVDVELFWFKAVEGATANADDVDVYGAQGSWKFDGQTVGGHVQYYNMNTYPLNAATGYNVTPQNSAYCWWFGAYWDGKIGPTFWNVDAIYDYGSVEGRASRSTLNEIDYRGWLARANVKYPWEHFEFGGGLQYASGWDDNDTTTNGLPGTTSVNGQANPDKFTGYVIPPGAEPGMDAAAQYGSVTYGSPLLSREPRNTADSGTNLNAADFGGMWNARAYAQWKATPWYKATLQGMYVGDTVKHGNFLGNALRADGTRKDDSTIGWEFTLSNQFQIYKNLSWCFVLGYMIAGDATDQYDPATGTNESIDNPWMIGSRLYYTF
jgi:hypothetical protein